LQQLYLPKLKKIKTISVFLLFVFVLQMLPIKQAVSYFYIDNVMVEEILHDTKEPSKNMAAFGDDHFINAVFHVFHPYIFELPNTVSAHNELFISCHAAEIETPPPNQV